MSGMKKPTVKTIFHTSRIFLFSLLALALLAVQGNSGGALELTHNKKDVLAYASSMTISDLLAATNKSRTDNGLSPLSLDSSLNTSAQLKANDMVANNYWSHVAPDGTQPWHWFDQVGYKYSTAGENLAYGFGTGKEVEVAWINSPTHKANVLGDYEDVGFGIANSATFQGHENTVVVAHYGKKRIESAPATSLQVATPGETAAEVSTTQQTGTSSTTSVLGLITGGATPTFAALSLGLIAIAAAGFGLAHRAFLKHALHEGKRFVVRHPLIDATALFLTLGVILTTTAGYLL